MQKKILRLCAALTIIGFGCSKKEAPPAPPTPPKASFSFTFQNMGQLPSIVNFKSTSTDGKSYKWSFGDGNTSTGAAPSNTYTKTGVYDVMLVVTGDGGKDSVTKQVTVTLDKPKAGFTFQLVDDGNYPTHVNFTNTSTGASTFKWSFGNAKGDTSILENATDSFFAPKTYNVKLVVSNSAGKDSITQPVTVTINKPAPAFSFTVLNPYNLPLNISTTNTTEKAVTYAWDFGDGGTSTDKAPKHTYTKGGIFTIKLVATNPGGSDSMTHKIKVSPYIQSYTAFDGKTYNLYTWEGATVALLMRTPNLNAKTMFKWARVMDSAYAYYYNATGQFPSLYTGVTYLNNHVTIADVPSSCGAGCGYLGTTGIEMLNAYTDRMYTYALDNKYDQELFYECGRNFWFYGSQLAYKANDPVTTGFAILMRFTSMDAVGVNPAPFNNIPWNTFRTGVEDLVDAYAGNTAYTWGNTLGIGAGISNPLGLGGSDLFASFCLRLKRDYGGDAFINKLWKQAGASPAAATTQDAVDNFILSCCAAANKNLTNLFTLDWRWPMSSAAKTAASQYP